MTPRPIFGNGFIYTITYYERPELWAIRPDGTGDVTDSRVAWKLTKDMPATASILLIDDLLYLVNDQGYALCLDAETGATVWRQRVKGKHSASPIYAGGRIYLFSEQGVGTVLQPVRVYKQLAENDLDERLKATPAVVGRSLLVRTATQLYCFQAGQPD